MPDRNVGFASLVRLEFHCHTVYSKDSLTSPKSLLLASRSKGIDRIVITDHNTTAGALAAQQIEPERVIIGEEILTTEGELLAAFVVDEVPPGLSSMEAISRLRAQGAFISVSHPFDKLRSGHWDPQHLLHIIPYVDAIEIFNARCVWNSANEQAQAFASQHDLRGTVGSDAHAAFEIGRAHMVLSDFHDRDTLKQALSSAGYVCRRSSSLVHLISRYATWVKHMSGLRR